MNYSNGDKNELFEKVAGCSRDLQRMQMNNVPSREIYETLMKKYDEKIIGLTLDILEKARYDKKSPYLKISEAINETVDGRFMDKLPDGKITSIEQFYDISTKIFFDLQKDERSKSCPILFAYNGESSKLGIIPILEDGNFTEYVNHAIKASSPKAYILCVGGTAVNSVTGERRKMVIVTGKAIDNTHEIKKVYHKDKMVEYDDVDPEEVVGGHIGELL